MIRVIGIVVMALSAVCVGYSTATNVKRRIDELIYVKRLMTMFQGELRYKNVALADGFAAVACRANGAYKELFLRLSSATEDNHSCTMAQVFAKNVDETLVGHTCLSKDDILRLKELGETMGYQDQNMQIANIDLYIERLTDSIEEDKAKMKDTMKMYRTLGVMGALVCILVFI